MIRIERVNIRAGQFRLNDLSLQVEAGEYVALMGHSGCGKTTLLEAICGLRRIDSGRILIDTRDVTHASPAERNLGYVPQDLALFPTMTVQQHLEFALRLRGIASSAIVDRVDQLARQLSIAHLLSRTPRGLSGGEAQRVALGRALSFQPPVLLLDEPLSALDDETREELLQLLGAIKQSREVTIIHITHNRSEAEALGDRVVQLKEIIAPVG